MDICEKCINKHYGNLRQIIRSFGQKNEQCEHCKSKDTFSISSCNRRIVQPIRALLRFYFDEAEYNEEYGGRNKHTVEWIFFNIDGIRNKDKFEEEVISVIFDNYYYDENIGISISNGPYEQFNMPLVAIKDNDSIKFEKLKKSVINREYSDAKIIINEIVDFCELHLKKEISSSNLFRARKGYKRKKRYLDGYKGEIHYQPFKGVDIGAPPIQSAKDGRINRKNMPFLYLAEDCQTAISEIKPDPGDIISTGLFTQNRGISIIDFTDLEIENFWENDIKLKIFTELYSLSREISKTVNEEEKYHYLFTQLICEEIHNRNIDGVCFNSSLIGKGNKKNYTIFNIDAYTYSEKNARTIKVEEVEIKYHYLPLITGDEIDYLPDQQDHNEFKFVSKGMALFKKAIIKKLFKEKKLDKHDICRITNINEHEYNEFKRGFNS